MFSFFSCSLIVFFATVAAAATVIYCNRIKLVSPGVRCRRLRILEARVETQLERCLTDERQSTRPDHDAGGGGDGCGGGGDDLDGGDDAVMSEAMPSCIGVSRGKNGSLSLIHI